MLVLFGLLTYVAIQRPRLLDYTLDARNPRLRRAAFILSDLVIINGSGESISQIRQVGDATTYSAPDLSGMNLRGAVLTRAQLQDTDLTGVELQGAFLIGTNLSGADLTRADLTEASLVGADLTRAVLKDATLASADVRWANLIEARVSVEAVAAADGWEDALLPNELLGELGLPCAHNTHVLERMPPLYLPQAMKRATDPR